MSWKKFFSEVPVQGATDGTYSAMGGAASGKPGPAKTNYSSYLPDVYSGAPNRIERYGQYNVMDMDSEVNAALDILAEFCTQNNTQNDTPFKFTYKQKATNNGFGPNVCLRTKRQPGLLSTPGGAISEVSDDISQYVQTYCSKENRQILW